MGAEHKGLLSSARPNSPGRKPYTGPPPRAPGEKPVSSIPSKFETILFKGPRERKGFGSEGRRFQDDEADKPGPGRYGGDASTSTMEFQHDSVGKRGYGPMASRDKRFKHHKLRYTGPGPGEYEQNIADFIATNFNRAATTANFHTEVPKLKPLPPKDTTAPQPGPGAYNPSGTRVGQKIDLLSAPQSHNSAFKAPGHKLTLSGSVDTPGPTKYSLPDGWTGVGKGGPGGGGSRGGTSSFAGRSMGSLNSGGMAPLAYIMEGTGGPSSKPDTGPGPGTYELQSFKSLAVDLERAAAQPSAAFQTPEFVDRWNSPLNPRQQGRGPAVAYNLGGTAPQKPAPAQRIGSPPKGVSAPFKSQSPGHADYDLRELSRAPGPAYYDSKLLAAKSYHVNARKDFVR